jgi:hypothetical protein
VRVHLLDVVWLPGCHCLKVYILDNLMSDTVLSYETQSKKVPPWSRLVSAPLKFTPTRHALQSSHDDVDIS